MSTLAEFTRGMTNTNAHFFGWMKRRADVDKILFIDFNQFDFKTHLKYALKNKLWLSNKNTLKKGINYRLDKVDNKVFCYLGYDFKNTRKIARELNLKNLEIWSFNPFDLSFLDYPDSLKIFYTIDDWRKNKLFSEKRALLDHNYQVIVNKADYIFNNGQRLKEVLWHNNPKAYWTPNGVDTEYFKDPNNSPAIAKEKIDKLLQGTKSPIIGYLGVITPDRVDFELVEYIIKNNQDKYFVFAGPVWQGFDSNYLVNKYKNIRFIGMMYYPDKPYLLSKFDVCLIPHQISEFIQSMDPIKLYDYLAAGKPIVTTKVIGTQKFQSLIYLADTKEDFNQKINQALAEESEESRQKRFQAVEPHSWQNRFEEVEKILNIN